MFHPRVSVFEVHVDNFEALHTIQELTEYVDKISTLALLIEKDHVLLMHYVLEFFELVGLIAVVLVKQLYCKR